MNRHQPFAKVDAKCIEAACQCRGTTPVHCENYDAYLFIILIVFKGFDRLSTIEKLQLVST